MESPTVQLFTVQPPYSFTISVISDGNLTTYVSRRSDGFELLSGRGEGWREGAKGNRRRQEEARKECKRRSKTVHPKIKVPCTTRGENSNVYPFRAKYLPN